jgi:hypothetical protein
VRVSKRGVDYTMDGLVAALIFSLVVLAAPSIAAGFVFTRDLFYHWNHFMMAQALAHQHGMALTLDVYSPYGLGWPTLMSSLSGILPLSHQNTIAFASVFCGVYFMGLYVLLRLVVTRRSLALAGTLFALWLGFFSPLFMQVPRVLSNWQWPSMLILRSPFDWTFFLALLIHARSGRPLASIVAGACAGLGLFFETDTGLMIVGTFVVYWVCALLFIDVRREGLAEGDAIGVAPLRPARTLLLSVAAFVAVLVVGFVIATHGRFLSEPAAFLSGWLGGLTNTIDVSARLFNRFLADASWEVLALMFGSLGVCLFAVSETALKALHRRLDPTSLFLGCVGFYGAGRLVLFAWNTEPIRIRLAGVAVAIILSVALLRAIEALERRSRDSPGSPVARLLAFAPFVVLIVAGGLLLSSPTLDRYPNAWNLARRGLPENWVYLNREGREVLLDRRIDALFGDKLRPAVAKVRALTLAGERVAVLDSYKTYIYLATGTKPWTGDAALFMNTFTRQTSRDLVDRFSETGPPYVLIQRIPPTQDLIRDTWTELRESLRPRYRVVEELPYFDLLLCDTCDDQT